MAKALSIVRRTHTVLWRAPLLHCLPLALTLLLSPSLAGNAFSADEQSAASRGYTDGYFAPKAWDAPYAKSPTALVKRVCEVAAKQADKNQDKPKNALLILLNLSCPEPLKPTTQAVVAEEISGPPALPIETTLLMGMTDWIAKRAKAEFNIWATDEMIGALCHKDKRAYFPNLCARYDGKDPYLATANADLQEVLREDLGILPAALLAANDPRKERGYVLANYWRALRANANAPIELAAGLADTPAVIEFCGAERDKQQMCSLYWFGILTRGYLSAHNGEFTTPDARAGAFLATLYIELGENTAQGQAFADYVKMLAALDGTGSLVAELKISLTKVKQAATLVGADISILKSCHAKATNDENCISAAQDLLQHVAQTLASIARIARESKLSTALGISGQERLNDEIARIEPVTRLLALIYGRQYREARFELYTALSCLSKTQGNGESEACKLWAPLAKDPDVNQTTKDLGRYLPVVLALASARTADDAERAIDTLAAPLGSWRAKRDRSMVSLNAYLGGQLGHERLRGRDVKEYGGNFSGISAPLGLDMTSPCSSGLCEEGSAGVFLSLLDLGNLVTARISGNSSEQILDTGTNAKLSKVLSPGLYARWSIGRSPWVFGVGLTYVPNARHVDLVNGQSRDVNAVRAVVFLGMDLPIFLIR